MLYTLTKLFRSYVKSAHKCDTMRCDAMRTFIDCKPLDIPSNHMDYIILLYFLFSHIFEINYEYINIVAGIGKLYYQIIVKLFSLNKFSSVFTSIVLTLVLKLIMTKNKFHEVQFGTQIEINFVIKEKSVLSWNCT